MTSPTRTAITSSAAIASPARMLRFAWSSAVSICGQESTSFRHPLGGDGEPAEQPIRPIQPVGSSWAL